MTGVAGTFLPGATSRLLPASIPFRYFGAAVAFHIAAWIALIKGADTMPRFAGGLGWPLAALHLTTLGVLAMAAIGASLQLLPVATRQPVAATRWPAAIWWIYTPGVAIAAAGMGTGVVVLLAAGGGAIVVALIVYAILLARNLIGAKGMPAVVAHGWAAFASLVVILGTAMSLVGTYVGAPGLARGTALALHIPFAAYGFMGMLALGLSYILVPMFALSPAPADRSAFASLAPAVAALLLAGAAAFGVATQPLRIAAIAAGSVAVVVHLRLMTAALATGLRRELGRSFRLVRIAWACLIASLPLALGVALDVPFDGIAALFGLVAHRRLAPHVPARHPAADRPLPGLDARGSRRTGCKAAAADTLVADGRATPRRPFRLPSRGACPARARHRRRQCRFGSCRGIRRHRRRRRLRGVLRHCGAADGGSALPPARSLMRINGRRGAVGYFGIGIP